MATEDSVATLQPLTNREGGGGGATRPKGGHMGLGPAVLGGHVVLGQVVLGDSWS